MVAETGGWYLLTAELADRAGCGCSNRLKYTRCVHTPSTSSYHRPTSSVGHDETVTAQVNEKVCIADVSVTSLRRLATVSGHMTPQISISAEAHSADFLAIKCAIQRCTYEERECVYWPT